MTPPLPSDPRHQRFADLILHGKSQAESYLEAGFSCSLKTAAANASRLLKRPDISAYMAAVRAAAVDETVLTLLEKRRFLARIVRIPLLSIEPDPGAKNGDLIKKYKCTESGTEIEKHDPLAAIRLDNELAGEGNPQADAIAQLAEALGALGETSPLPVDRM